MSVIDDELARIHARHARTLDGEVASYIPELTKGDPDRFGIAVATADGHTYATGHARAPFTIQSVSKPFIYGMALDDRGLDAVVRRVGVEPSGDAFNSIVMDEVHNRPMNPMVNAGAIACSSMVAGTGFDERLKRVLDTFRAYTGRDLEIDEAVWRSESATGHRNRAIAYLELSSDMIEGDVDEHLELYFAQCSILVTAADLAMMAATLANGGVNPVTGERALRAENVGNVLSVMATCGMYDWSGEWMLRVGLPAKSGVGGGIIAVLPGQIGVGTFAPRLDEHGNSCNGVRACEDIGREFSLHLFDAGVNRVPVVRRRSDASIEPSRRYRRRVERELLAAEGAAVVTLELQGDLFFATAEQLVRATAETPDASTILLDASRVGRANASAVHLLTALGADLAAAGTEVVVAEPSPDLRAALVDAIADAVTDADAIALADAITVADSYQAALEAAEDRLLTALGHPPPHPGSPVDIAEVDILADLSAEEFDAVRPLLDDAAFRPGDVIVAEGDTADRVWFLTSGVAAAWLDHGEPSARRLATMAAGTVFGETALLEGGTRTSTVAADTAVTAAGLRMSRLADLGVDDRELQRRLLAGLGRRLSAMLSRAATESRGGR